MIFDTTHKPIPKQVPLNSPVINGDTQFYTHTDGQRYKQYFDNEHFNHGEWEKEITLSKNVVRWVEV